MTRSLDRRPELLVDRAVEFFILDARSTGEEVEHLERGWAVRVPAGQATEPQLLRSGSQTAEVLCSVHAKYPGENDVYLLSSRSPRFPAHEVSKKPRDRTQQCECVMFHKRNQ